ncbi:MAG: hypothetical protein JO199_10950, partial [Candidatus Eremiobacteraeota bacterium]|nr:hypothetical protein [Candidatus Eremiobacteraeota bacterium]
MHGSVDFSPFSEPASASLPSLHHFERLLGDHGIVQFSRGAIPDLDSGFCLDDNARAILVAVAYRRLGSPNPAAKRMGDAAMAFFADASRDAPRYRNVMDRNGRFVDDHASPEALGRLLWALGVTSVCADLSSWRSAACRQLSTFSHAVGGLTSLHARSYAMLGLAALVDPH